MRHTSTLLLCLVSTAGIGLASQSAAAQAPASTDPVPEAQPQPAPDAGDIIVTARKRQESILRVPVTEAVISAGELQRNQINDLGHIATRVPGLGIGQQVATIGAQVSIRGVGTTTLDAGVDQSVTLNIDGLQLSQGLAFKSGLFDLAQAEVLKGPQSLYYGKNSTAGVIALHTADPGSTPELSTSTGYETEGKEWRTQLIASTPMTSTLGVRLAGQYSDYKGFLRNNAEPNPIYGGVKPMHSRIGGDKSLILRGTLLWKPTPDFDARLKLNYDWDRGTGPAGQLISCPDGTGPVTTPPVPFLNSDCKLDNKAAVTDMNPAAFLGVYNSGQQIYLQEQKFGTLELHYRPAEALTLTSLTGYYRVASRTLFNGTVSGNAPGLASDNKLRRRDFTEEVRLESDYSTPLNFLIGGFYQDGRAYNFIRLKTNTFVNTLLRFPFPASLYNGYSQFDIKSYSGFGQLRWKPIPAVEIAAGVRYTDERRDDVVRRVALNANFTDGAQTNVPLITPEIHSRTWSPELTISWNASDTTTVYGSAKQGYKSGSFAISRIFTTPTAEASFGDEKVQGGEIGLKTRVLDRSLFINVAGYYYYFKGLQVGTNTNQCVGGETPPCAPKNLTLNAGAARVYGVDLDMSYRPRGITGLALRGAVNWNHARFVRLDGISCSGGQTAAQGCNELIGGTLPAQNLSGIPLVRAPNWQLNGGFDYEVPLSASYTLAFNGNVQYSTRYLTQITDRRDSDQPAYAKVDFNVTLRGPDDHWEVAFIANNLTNKLTYGNTTVANLQAGGLYGAGGRDEVLAFLDRGRELWARLTFKL